MKNLKFLLLAFIFITLVGCSANEVKTTTYTLGNQQITSTYILESKGDTITKMTIDQITDISTIGLADEELQTLINEYKNLYNFEGVEYTPTIKDRKIEEHIVVDTEKADMSNLVSTGIAQGLNANGNVEYLSLKETIKDLESVGATLVK